MELFKMTYELVNVLQDLCHHGKSLSKPRVRVGDKLYYIESINTYDDVIELKAEEAD